MQQPASIKRRRNRLSRGAPVNFAGCTPGGEIRFFVHFGQNSPNHQDGVRELCSSALARGFTKAACAPKILATSLSFSSRPSLPASRNIQRRELVDKPLCASWSPRRFAE